MLNQLRRGSTESLNRLRGERGELTVDLEAMGLRLHDGQTPGGFVAIGEQAVQFITGPGSQDLLEGTSKIGFYGEVDPELFFGKEELLSLVGLQGTPSKSTLSWFKFAYADKTMFVARHALTEETNWNELNSKKLVFGETTVEKNGRQYVLRLLKAVASDTGIVVTNGGPMGREYKAFNSILSERYPNARDYWYMPNFNMAQESVSYKNLNGTFSGYKASFRGGFLFATKPDATKVSGWLPVLELIA